MFRKYFYKAVIKSFDDYDSLSNNVSGKESFQLSLSSGSKVAAALTSCAGYSEPLTLTRTFMSRNRDESCDNESAEN